MVQQLLATMQRMIEGNSVAKRVDRNCRSITINDIAVLAANCRLLHFYIAAVVCQSFKLKHYSYDFIYFYLLEIFFKIIKKHSYALKKVELRGNPRW